MSEWTFALTPALPDPSWGTLYVLAEGWDIPLPEAKRVTLEPPGGNGLVDVSTALTAGEPVYGTRTVAIPIFIEADIPAASVDNLHAAQQWIGAAHGRTGVELRVSSLPGWHLTGRLDATDMTVDDLSGDVDATLVFTAQPLWEADALTVSDTVAASPSPGTPMHLDSIGHTVPLLVTASAAVQISDGTTTWQVPSGTDTPLDGLVLPWAGGADLQVIGDPTASVHVSYRQVSL